MPDEITEKLEELFRKRLKTEEYLRKFISSHDESFPHIWYPACCSRSKESLEQEFRQEYLGEFVPPPPKDMSRRRSCQGEADV
jgi:hypothetical protein